jgi:hypothetical protein
MLILISVFATGCVTAQSSQPDTKPSVPQYTEAASSALAFDPPIAEGAVHPEFARGPRASSAFFGYQESTSESYISATDDLQGNQWGDIYTKESISVKSGVRYR